MNVALFAVIAVNVAIAVFLIVDSAGLPLETSVLMSAVAWLVAFVLLLWTSTIDDEW